MAEPSIPVSAIRKAFEDELDAITAAMAASDSGGKAYLRAHAEGQLALIRTLEEQTGTPIRRRPR
jgi:hypothetical protein